LTASYEAVCGVTPARLRRVKSKPGSRIGCCS